jgi:hypothetical protein
MLIAGFFIRKRGTVIIFNSGLVIRIKGFRNLEEILVKAVNSIEVQNHNETADTT